MDWNQIYQLSRMQVIDYTLNICEFITNPHFTKKYYHLSRISGYFQSRMKWMMNEKARLQEYVNKHGFEGINWEECAAYVGGRTGR